MISLLFLSLSLSRTPVPFHVLSLATVIREFTCRAPVSVARKPQNRNCTSTRESNRDSGKNAARAKCQATRRHGHTARCTAVCAQLAHVRDARGELAISATVYERSVLRVASPTAPCARRNVKNRQNTHPHTSCRDRRTVYVVQRPPYCAALVVTSAVARYDRCLAANFARVCARARSYRSIRTSR